MRRHVLHSGDCETESLRLLAPRPQVGGVIVGEDEHFVVGPERDSAGDPVVPLTGVARDDDLLGRDTEHRCQQRARGLAPVAHEARSHRRARVGLVAAGGLVQRFHHRDRRRAEVGRVQEDDVAREQVSGPHVLPVLLVRRPGAGRERRVGEVEVVECEGAPPRDGGGSGQREQRRIDDGRERACGLQTMRRRYDASRARASRSGDLPAEHPLRSRLDNAMIVSCGFTPNDVGSREPSQT